MMEIIQQLTNRIEALEESQRERDFNQIKLPLDELSRNVLNIQFPIKTGTGAYGTQDIVLTGDAQTIKPPAQPSGTLTVVVGGITYNLLYK